MKTLLLLACSLAALHSGVAADWREQLTTPEPGSFPPLRPLKATYGFGWGAIKAARAEFVFSKLNPTQNRLAVSAKSLGAVRTLWRLDAQHVALGNADTLQPISFRQTEAYRDETLTTSVEFRPDGVSRVRTSSKKDAGEGKAKRFEMPNVFDLHSALLFIRSQPLRAGDSYKLVVYPSTNPFLAQIDVRAAKKVKVAGALRDAIQLDLKLRRISKKKELEPHQKFKRASAWVSDDRDRLI
jgi:hypothetical protein